jgi:hypothetical protein
MSEDSICLELEALKARLLEEGRVYGDVAARLILESGQDFERAYARAGQAKQAYEEARKRLQEHTSLHRCESSSEA